MNCDCNSRTCSCQYKSGLAKAEHDMNLLISWLIDNKIMTKHGIACVLEIPEGPYDE